MHHPVLDMFVQTAVYCANEQFLPLCIYAKSDDLQEEVYRMHLVILLRLALLDRQVHESER